MFPSPVTDGCRGGAGGRLDGCERTTLVGLAESVEEGELAPMVKGGELEGD